MGFFSDFKKFAMRGNVVDLAVGVIIGAAFGGVTKSMVEDVLMPPLGLATGKVDVKDKYAPLDLPAFFKLREELLPARKSEAEAANQRLKAEGKPPLPIPDSVWPTLEEATKKGIPVVRYGQFINTIINFIFVAFGVFLLVKLMTKLQKSAHEAPPAPNKEVELLTEIRDLLKTRPPNDRAGARLS